MLGIGLPSEHLPSGPYGSGRRFDFRLLGLDADLDGRPFLRGGKYTRDSGVR